MTRLPRLKRRPQRRRKPLRKLLNQQKLKPQRLERPLQLRVEILNLSSHLSWLEPWSKCSEDSR